MPYRFIMYVRYLAVWEGISDLWFWKGWIAIVVAMLATPPQLIALVCVLVIMDFVTGIYASLMTGRKIRSLKMRQTVAKSLEYAVMLAILTMISNSFDLLDWIQPTSYAFVALTEAKSIFENILLKGSRAETVVKRIFKRLREEGYELTEDEEQAEKLP